MFNSLREWFKAWRRGEKRVGPKGATGRVFADRADNTGGVSAKAAPKGSISARVWRKDTGEWEDLGVIAPSVTVSKAPKPTQALNLRTGPDLKMPK